MYILTLASLAGEGRKYVGNEALLETDTDKVIKYVKQSNGDAVLARLLKIPGSLPIRIDGILAATLEELINSPPRRLRIVADHSLFKAIGLNRVRNSQVLPESYLHVQDAHLAPNGRFKNWFFRPLPNSNEAYCYLPLSYIP
jgi:hypothetical protein